MDFYVLKISLLIFPKKCLKWVFFAIYAIPLSTVFMIRTFNNSIDGVLLTVSLYYWMVSDTDRNELNISEE